MSSASQLAQSGGGIEFGDFSIQRDIENLRHERMTTEMLRSNVNAFLKEYLTGLTTNRYSYEYLENNSLGAQGWKGSLEDSYYRAIFDGCQEDPKLQAMRIAEYNSFIQIQEALRTNPNATAILQSPNRGWGYSYVSIYRSNIDEQNKQKIDVSIHRIWDKEGKRDHAGVRENWQQKGSGINAKLIQQEGNYALNPFNENFSEETREAFRDPEICNILNNALIVEDNTIPDEMLINKYYSLEENYDFYSIKDRIINEQLEEFQPEVQEFMAHLLYDVDGVIRTGYHPEGMIKGIDIAFKELLVKAKVHFDEEASRSMWGDQAVEEIKRSILTAKKQLSGGYMRIDSSNTIRKLQIAIEGSCGKVSIGEVEIDKLLQATKVNDRLSRENSKSATDFICDKCQVSHFIKVRKVHNCNGCGQNVAC